MSVYVVEGQRKLEGEISVHGAKNSVLPILAATVLCDGECVIENCPDISDVDTSIKILTHFGIECTVEKNTVTVKNKGITSCDIPDSLMREMRSSVVFSGAVLGKTGRAVMSSPGGCELGPRPIDIHIKSFKALGADVAEKHGYLKCECANKLKGCRIVLPVRSVGATENTVLAAVLASGITTVHNAAREPEIVDLCEFLNSCGAKIYGHGGDTVVIEGVAKLHGAHHRIIPDRIVASTYMACAAATGGSLLLKNVNCNNLEAVISIYREAGCDIRTNNNGIIIKSRELNAVKKVQSGFYPAFPTDAGPMAVAALSVANGTSVFVENIFESRFKYVSELMRFGVKADTVGKAVIITGNKSLYGTDCVATDLRGGAALIVAALAAEGTTHISNINYIKRGYDGIDKALLSVGAKICEK